MRKVDVFGKKISKMRALPFMIVIFLGVLLGYYLVNVSQTSRLEALEAKERDLNLAINQLVIEQQENDLLDYGTIYEAISEGYDRQDVINHLLTAQALVAINDTQMFEYDIVSDASQPVNVDLSDDIHFVKVTVDFVTDDIVQVYDFIESLTNQQALIYLNQAQVVYTVDETLQVEIVYYMYYFMQ